ncbi:MAG: hypothetical protein H5T69_17090, partial [Chloroflexi bacterium]|nr:hypothetical protein [Chloroflexota bacterium]
MEITDRHILRYTCLWGLILALLLLAAPRARADGQVHLYYFFDPHCAVCEEVHKTVLEPLQAEYGDRLVVEERSIAEAGGFELLLELET